ncbi:MAG: MATE family efflux transporter [Candidatus Methanomethylophilaceae archaeon]
MKESSPNDYIAGKVLRSNLLVTILVTLSATLSIVLNSLIVGRYLGADALAVFGLSSPVLILLSAFAGVFGNGGTIVCARYLGPGDARAIRNNFTVTMLASVAVGAVCTLLVAALASPLTVALGGTESMHDMMTGYIIGLALSSIPFLIAQNLLLYIRMDGSQKLALVAILVTVISDVGFAIFSVTSDIGMTGVGLAIGVSNILCMIVCGLHFLKKGRRLGFARPYDVKRELSDVVSAGIPTAINRGSQTLKNLFLNNYLMIMVGTSAVVALSVQTSVYQFTIAICTGYGITVAMMCGMFYGERDKASMVSTLRVSVRSGFILSTLVAIPLFILAPDITTMFIKDGGDPEECVNAVRLFMISLPTSTVCLILLYLHQTLGNMMLCNAISLTRGFLYVLLVSVALYPAIGTDAVWISFALADVLSILTLMVAIRFKTGRFPRSLEDMIVTPDGFDGITDICSITIHDDIDEVMALTTSIEGACLEKGVDEERAHKVALCIEEMAGNVVKFAFSDEKQHCMDIRVLLQNGDLIFRLRDDGVAFNPLEEVSEDHLGIRVVRATAKSINYSNSIGLNNLTVVI